MKRFRLTYSFFPPVSSKTDFRTRLCASHPERWLRTSPHTSIRLCLISLILINLASNATPKPVEWSGTDQKAWQKSSGGSRHRRIYCLILITAWLLLQGTTFRPSIAVTGWSDHTTWALWSFFHLFHHNNFKLLDETFRSGESQSSLLWVSSESLSPSVKFLFSS